MKSAAKWLVTGGALLFIFGFLLPVIYISRQTTGISLSLLQISGVSYWFILYLIPIGALVMLILALIPTNDQATRTAFIIGQIAGLGMALFILFATLVYLLFQPQELQNSTGLGILLPSGSPTSSLDIWPGIGFFVLLLGIGLAIVGITGYFTSWPNLLSRQQNDQTIASKKILAQADGAKPEEEAKPAVVIVDAYLEATKGELTGKKIHLIREDFSIGRSRENDLQLSGKNVSRKHTRLRFAQGGWFIQDQKSSMGTFVNEKRIQATRLNSGDKIKIGDDIFVFRT